MRKRHIFMIACVCLFVIQKTYAQDATAVKVFCGHEEDVPIPDSTYVGRGTGYTKKEACEDANRNLAVKIQQTSYYCPTEACLEIGGTGCLEEKVDDLVEREFEGRSPFHAIPQNCSIQLAGLEYFFNSFENKWMYSCLKKISCVGAEITAKCTPCPHGECDKISQDQIDEVGELSCRENEPHLFQNLFSL
jgi:hypothetical protein